MTPDDETDIEAVAAAAHATTNRLGTWILLAVETVARTHPDMLRDALGRVVDLSAWEAEARRIAALHQRLRTEAMALRQEMAELRNQCQELRTLYEFFAAPQPRRVS